MHSIDIKGTAATVVLGGLALVALIGGVTCAARHIAAGVQDPTAYADCLKDMLLGLGVLSPGLNRFKVGIFSRPT